MPTADLKQRNKTPSARPQGGGRAFWEPTDEQREAALVLFAKGATVAQVAATLGVGTDAIPKHLGEEMSRGWEWGNLELYGMLWTAAKAGNIAAIIFLAKNRLGMSDRLDHNHSGNMAPVRAEISIRVEYVYPGHPNALAPPPAERFKGPA